MLRHGRIVEISTAGPEKAGLKEGGRWPHGRIGFTVPKVITTWSEERTVEGSLGHEGAAIVPVTLAL